MMGHVRQLSKDPSEGTRISAYTSNGIEIFAQGSDLKLGSSSDNVHHLTLAMLSSYCRGYS